MKFHNHLKQKSNEKETNFIHIMSKANELAFPTDYNFSEEHKDGSFQTGNTIAHMPGISTRLLLAGMAMASRLGNGEDHHPELLAKYILECTDELIKQEEETR